MSDSHKIFSFGDNDNLAIKASAGTGKTFRLAMRFIALLFCNPELKTEQIVAITFTRKAAAEILDKIIEQLLKLRDPENRNTLEDLKNAGLLPKEFTPAAVPGILERILTARELQISTIDSFLVKIIQAFAPEFGLSGAVEMIDENRDSGEQETIEQLIRQEKENLLPLLRDYAQGKDARNFTRNLKEFLLENYSTYLLYPEEKLWGNLPDVKAVLTDAELERILTSLDIEIQRYDPQSAAGADAVKKIQAFIDAAKTGKTGELKKSLETLTAPNGELFIKRGNTKDFRKLAPISQEMLNDLDKLSRHIALLNLRLKKQKSRAAYRILECFDAIYAANIRNAGHLAFRDIPKVLGSLDPETKLELEYRLDTKNLHYMLDEFQDTSTRQWGFLSNLMNEAISGTMQSFFMVGDVKQSLYQWRFGNPKLFDEICRRYSISQITLEDSRRSEPEIIDAVNGVFNTPDRIENPVVKEAVRRLNFSEHRAVKKDSGYVRLQQFPKIEDEAERAARRAEEILKILHETKPFEHDRTVAILLRTNKEIARYKQCLLALDKNLPISTEGAVMPKESMACTFLTLLLRLAAHPSDPMARGALPLFSWQGNPPFTAAETAEALQLPGSADWDVLSRNFRILLQETKIHGVVSRFQTAYASRLSEFDRDCLAIAAELAVDFTGSVDEYLASLEKAKGTGVSVKNTIQIMTIHKSKGLEFTMVILPELGAGGGGGGEKLEIAPMDVTPNFVSYLPVEFARQFLPDEFEQIHEKIQADKLYEKLCGLYVAMTRAERALYMYVANDTGNPGKSFRADQFLVQTLSHVPDENGFLYSHGKADWYHFKTKEEVAKEKEEQKQPQKITLTNFAAKRPDVSLWQSPSLHFPGEETESAIPPEYRFEGGDAAELGTRIHAMFEAVEYLDSVPVEKIRAIAGNDGITRQAWELWEKAMAPDGEIAHALTRRPGATELWRERKFLLRTSSGDLISGCFDRVEIMRDPSGQAERAVIFDYKSDALDAPEEFLTRHGGQLNTYRKACAQMLNLPETNIRCVILALRLGKAVNVPAEQ